MCLVAWFLFLYWGLCSVFTVCGILWILLVSSILVYTGRDTLNTTVVVVYINIMKATFDIY